MCTLPSGICKYKHTKLMHAQTLFLSRDELFAFRFDVLQNCRKHLHRPGSQSPPLPPPPPEEDENQNFGRPRTQSVGPLAPIVPDDQNLPGWVPKNYIEKGTEFDIFFSFFFKLILFQLNSLILCHKQFQL